MRSIQEAEEEEKTDTEITLGMKSLLGVFFGLVLICGIFFGLGYSLGRGGTRTASGVVPDSTVKANAPKLPTTSAESPPDNDDTANPTTYTPGPDAQESGSTASVAPEPPKPSASVIKQVSPATATDTSATQSGHALAVTSPAPVTSAVSSTSVPQTGNAAMVQVAAISRQQDADVLVAALKKHGYSAVVRNDPKDNLLHVQLGPFATRDEARTMRAKLLADGYNAILK